MLAFLACLIITLCCEVVTPAFAEEQSNMSSNVPPLTASITPTQLSHFWQQGYFSSFQGVAQLRINYAQFITNASNPCLVISSGRKEGYFKYQQLVYQLAAQGYNIFLIDHRGQGISQRMLANHDKGYVRHFDDYATDLHKFIQTIVLPRCQTKPYLLAHSMGAAIAVRYMQLNPQQIRAAVLASPMIAFNTGGIPFWLTKGLVYSLNKLNQWSGMSPWYFFGQGNYQPAPFADNHLTHDAERYQQLLNEYQQVPERQLGGVTVHWMQQALLTKQLIFAQIDKLDAPIQVIQAGDDHIVDNHVQDEFCQQLHQHNPASCPTGKPLVINHAWHELFMEQAQYRTPAINAALAWFKAH